MGAPLLAGFARSGDFYLSLWPTGCPPTEQPIVGVRARMRWPPSEFQTLPLLRVPRSLRFLQGAGIPDSDGEPSFLVSRPAPVSVIAIRSAERTRLLSLVGLHVRVQDGVDASLVSALAAEPAELGVEADGFKMTSAESCSYSVKGSRPFCRRLLRFGGIV
jgi:hypothetical protein